MRRIHTSDLNLETNQEINNTKIFITPFAKKMALEKSLDINNIKGTGPLNRIISRDIMYSNSMEDNSKINKLKLPNFNKAIDDRFPKKKWNKINKRPDVIIFEGWCVGARAEANKILKKSINSLEKANDQKLIWRKYHQK